ncbi:bifunctional riboflavin kinase/FAD synthetase [Paenibacillus sp. F411]|uniref:Riboflavin biosynthesis protein n=1 Tax=Paenibacillus algicola TaxID=2565926 RepID=A0A4P8XNL3_9BACL|nr:MULTISPECIES: bifunctional riboflavin kinase/FAD synthetase [Paenibacillus]MBO2945707.1 bifunctional riboflavin kinase/FAD synthetase [Paenibacillus sp. F411]QCT03171.1 riboflavin biosynthesis protein RibF [Paenibacillus algicola]
MKIVSLSYPLTEAQIAEYGHPQTAAIGQFDGLHLGHVSVIQTAVNSSRKAGIPAAVITFYPHPKEVMRKGSYDGYLTPQSDKEDLLAQLGVDILYVIEFNESFSRITPEQFVKDMLLPLSLHTVVVGFDFRFGHKGAGDAEDLHVLGNGEIEVVIVPPLLVDGEKVGSSSIREALADARLEDVNRWLGRRYRISGTVVHGEKRGRQIGFPTANLDLEASYVTPSQGVYAVRARCSSDQVWRSGVMSIGMKPTFHEGMAEPVYEVHLLDFDGDLYGQVMTVDLVSHIRGQLKFNSINELIDRIGQDAAKAREQLSHLS